MMLLRLKSLVIFSTLAILLSSNLFAEKLQYGYVEYLNTSDLQLQVSDEGFLLSRFTIVQDYGKLDQRLPLSSIRTGSLVALDVQYSDVRKGLVVNKIMIMPNEEVLNQLLKSENED